jgi:methylmalonyl-CoA/ethylmalonyl-CoA epimerase
LKIHHIGYLVKSIEAAIQEFVKLGYRKLDKIVYDEERKAYFCFMQNDMVQVELVSPKDKTSVVGNLIKRYGNSPYHICYESSDFEEELKKKQQEGYLIVQMPAIALAIGNKRVAFLFHEEIGLVEIVEKHK